MSEDEGHSEDESEGGDGDNDDHNALLVSPAPHAARPRIAEAVVKAVVRSIRCLQAWRLTRF